MTAHISILDNPTISNNFYEVLCYHQKRLDRGQQTPFVNRLRKGGLK